MGVTFLIGNGFDLNLGMKTRYTDMYDSYIKSESKSTVIYKFKKDLQKEEHNHYQNWSDFEMGMAKYAQNFTNENEFIECIRDFKAHMVDWLKREEDVLLKDLWSKIDYNKTRESVLNSQSGCTPNNQYNILKVMFVNGVCRFNFITFNYTTILDKILFEISGQHEAIGKNRYIIEDNVIHIHGDLYHDVVLGVDNKNQVRSSFDITRKTDMAFIKPAFNDAFDHRRVDNAKKLINDNSVICAYGLSLGESDDMWAKILKDWLLASPQHHLIYYVYDDSQIPSYNYDEKMEKEDELKEEFYEKLELSETQIPSVRNRIHIPVSYNIFDIMNQNNEKELATV